MQRILEDHKVGILNDQIQVMSTDQPGIGGAHNEYVVSLSNGTAWTVRFHDSRSGDINGDITTANGASHEAFLAIMADRLRCFQQGDLACQQNAEALDHIEAAIEVLHSRTKDRLTRGVHGTLEK